MNSTRMKWRRLGVNKRRGESSAEDDADEKKRNDNNNNEDKTIRTKRKERHK